MQSTNQHPSNFKYQSNTFNWPLIGDEFVDPVYLRRFHDRFPERHDGSGDVERDLGERFLQVFHTSLEMNFTRRHQHVLTSFLRMRWTSCYEEEWTKWLDWVKDECIEFRVAYNSRKEISQPAKQLARKDRLGWASSCLESMRRRQMDFAALSQRERSALTIQSTNLKWKIRKIISGERYEY